MSETSYDVDLEQAVSALASTVVELRTTADGLDELMRLAPARDADVADDLAWVGDVLDTADLNPPLEDTGELESLVATLHEELTASLGAVEGVSNRAGDAFEEARGLVERVDAVSDLASTTAAVLEECRSVLEEAAKELVGTIEEELAARTGGAFTNASALLEHALTAQIDGTLDELRSRVAGALDGLADESDRVAGELGEQWTGMLSIVAETLGSELAGEIEERVRGAIMAGAEALASDIAEAATTMTLGAKITTAMSSVLPALVAAKKAAQFLNAAKGLFRG